MNIGEILKISENYIKDNFIKESTGHDWWHIKRVHDLAIKINETEHQNEFVIKMIALFHDVFDEKFSEGNVVENLIGLMKKLNIYNDIEQDELENILNSINNLGYKGGFNTVEISEEGKIVQDADRIDSIGAIGIARCFAFGGKKSNTIYNPEVGIIEVNTYEEYRNKERHSINHFYEKLLKIKDTINTETAKMIAIERTKYMEEFLEEFFKEWEGQA
jgi:hydrolase, HD